MNNFVDLDLDEKQEISGGVSLLFTIIVCGEFLVYGVAQGFLLMANS